LSTRLASRSLSEEVDPRIAARRDAVEADRRSRRWRRVAVVVGVLAVLGGAWYATRTPLFDVEQVEVVGAARTPVEVVQEASGAAIGEAMLDVDPGDVEAAVEALPWVATAEVERRLDGRVVITVVERTPVATAPTADGGRAVLDAGGRVLEVVPAGAAPELDPAFVPIEGLVAPGPGGDVALEGAGALEVVTRLTPGLRARVVSVVVAPNGDLSLLLRPQGTVDLGPPVALDDKLGSLVTVLAQVDQSGLGTIGLRVPDLPTITRPAP
jgi:cell division protein FtsQ